MTATAETPGMSTEQTDMEDVSSEMEDVSSEIHAATQNSDNLLAAYDPFPSVEEFLHCKDVRIPLHPTVIDKPQETVQFTYHTDGILVELDMVQAVTRGIHYIFLPHFERHMLVPHYHFMKKHLDLTSFNAKGLKGLHNSLGYVIADVDGGYHLNMSAVPLHSKDPAKMVTVPRRCRDIATELFNKVVFHFKESLLVLEVNDIQRPTIQKQCLSKTAEVSILQQDLTFILGLLDDAIAKANSTDKHLRIIVSITKFGQKEKDPVNLDFLNMEHVKSMSIHLACIIAPKDTRLHFLWSRYGLQDIVGLRGRLYSVLSMHEAVNFISNTDTMPMDITQPLLALLSTKTLRSLQLYVTSPRVHLQIRNRHPVSGVIATCGLTHYQTRKSMISMANAYLDHMDDLKLKLVCQLKCCIEQVVYLGDGDILPKVIQPLDYFCQEKLEKLLESKTVILPFLDDETAGLVNTLSQSMEYLTTLLRRMFESNACKGGYTASWTAYQIELALEEIVYGHPLSPLDYHYSASLGTCSTNPRSMTHCRGFLGLAPLHSASVGEGPPPLMHWIKDKILEKNINRVFPLTETFEAPAATVGAEMITILLGELLKTPKDVIPLTNMKSTNKMEGWHVTGARSIEGLAEELATRDSFQYPMTFGRARTMVEEAGFDVAGCLQLGILQLKLHFFPAVKFVDTKNTKRLTWKYNDYIELHLSTTAPSIASQVASLTEDICQEIERRGLAWPRTMQRYKDHGMPWVERALLRLPSPMSQAGNLIVMTFVSCVGMLMNNDEVSFEQLKTLVEDMPMSQYDLQSLLILGRRVFKKTVGFYLWSLHSSIPYRMLKPTPRPKDVPAEKVIKYMPVQQEAEDIESLQDDTNMQPAFRSISRTVPLSCKSRWSGQELAMINCDPACTPGRAYNDYVKSCQEMMLQVRSFKAFQQKRNTMLE